MRTIKYRGKTKNGEWLYGDLLQVANEVFIAPSDGDWFDFIPWSRNNVFHLPAAKYAVIPDTVGQFTGMHDKDGREIYEGDIVRHEYMRHLRHREPVQIKRVGRIDYMPNGGGFAIVEPTDRTTLYVGIAKECTVVGTFLDKHEPLGGGLNDN